MSAQNDGGPAFPGFGEVFTTDANGRTMAQSAWGIEGGKGMSLRDYFAGRASDPPQWWMDAWIAKNFPIPPGAMLWTGPTQAQQVQARAQWAYEFADAMLAARAEVKP